MLQIAVDSDGVRSDEKFLAEQKSSVWIKYLVGQFIQAWIAGDGSFLRYSWNLKFMLVASKVQTVYPLLYRPRVYRRLPFQIVIRLFKTDNGQKVVHYRGLQCIIFCLGLCGGARTCGKRSRTSQLIVPRGFPPISWFPTHIVHFFCNLHYDFSVFDIGVMCPLKIVPVCADTGCKYQTSKFV